eukprot:scaffold79282_cov29-Tisochrysis_lutea.AAC.1
MKDANVPRPASGAHRTKLELRLHLVSRAEAAHRGGSVLLEHLPNGRPTPRRIRCGRCGCECSEARPPPALPLHLVVVGVLTVCGKEVSSLSGALAEGEAEGPAWTEEEEAERMAWTEEGGAQRGGWVGWGGGREGGRGRERAEREAHSCGLHT